MLLTANIPMPLQVVLDDVGWWSGRDGSKENEPFRTGAPRDHVPADYAAIASLGRRIGAKPQACMILGEWDTRNLLAKLPTSQWMGAKWDNQRWVGPWLEEAAEILRANRDHIELALHGLGHEYWLDGKMTRAEWHNCETGVMWPVDQVRAHLEMFSTLLDQYRLGPFPKVHCPCAGGHRFGDGERGIDGLLHAFGVRYTGTPFMRMACSRATQHQRFGIDAGVLTIDRQYDLVPWYEIDAQLPADVAGPIAGMHWPNILHRDPARNEEVVARWAAFFIAMGKRYERVLTRDSASTWTQYVHHLAVRATPGDEEVTLHFDEFDRLPLFASTGEFVVKVHAMPSDRLIAEQLELLSREDMLSERYATLRLRRTGQGVARIRRA